MAQGWGRGDTTSCKAKLSAKQISGWEILSIPSTAVSLWASWRSPPSSRRKASRSPPNAPAASFLRLFLKDPWARLSVPRLAQHCVSPRLQDIHHQECYNIRQVNWSNTGGNIETGAIKESKHHLHRDSTIASCLEDHPNMFNNLITYCRFQMFKINFPKTSSLHRISIM